MKYETLVLRCMLTLVLFGGLSIIPSQRTSREYDLIDLPGTPATAFDGDGLVTTPIGSLRVWGKAVVIQSNGKIVVAGP